MADRCFFFGCWNRPGHFLVGLEGERAALPNKLAYDLSRELDGQFAPKLDRGGAVTFVALPGLTDSERSTRYNLLREAPQGQFLRHELLGFTLIQWWDGNQGDDRGGCNSSILLEGIHTSDEVLAAGRLNFPHVFARLAAAGVEVAEVNLG